MELTLLSNSLNLFSKSRDFVAQRDIYRYMKTKTKHLSIRLTNQQYQKLLDMLKKEGMTKSEVVRLALADYLTK